MESSLAGVWPDICITQSLSAVGAKRLAESPGSLTNNGLTKQCVVIDALSAGERTC